MTNSSGYSKNSTDRTDSNHSNHNNSNNDNITIAVIMIMGFGVSGLGLRARSPKFARDGVRQPVCLRP